MNSHGKIVYGQNIAQTFNMALKGGTGLGFIARSQSLHHQYNQLGSHWNVPTHLHQPIKQDGIVVKSTKKSLVAKNLLNYLIMAQKSHNLLIFHPLILLSLIQDIFSEVKNKCLQDLY